MAAEAEAAREARAKVNFFKNPNFSFDYTYTTRPITLK